MFPGINLGKGAGLDFGDLRGGSIENTTVSSNVTTSGDSLQNMLPLVILGGIVIAVLLKR
jgi:hypothetical protein